MQTTDLAALGDDDLAALADEIRRFLVDRVCATGGHLGVNLGVVELTIALHRVFHSPNDVIVFDTGHQSYVHKILTGRAPGFHRLRQRGGLSGYPSRTESPHDWVENSHASTALCYADGIAKAMALRGEPGRRVVAVIGDGALTGGLAWEGLNNLAVARQRPVVVVLNDNGRSYAPTVGGIAHQLADLREHKPKHGAGANVFERLGFDYLGPVDGHNIAELEAALRQAARVGRPVVVHAVTRKGHGYPPAEADEADRMHGIGVLDPATGMPGTVSKPTWTQVFGAEIAAAGARRPDVVCVTAAMLNPVGLTGFARRFPDRVFDVGIAEQHAVCSAAGMAMAGLHPVVCLYATFLNRAFDQVLLDVALHRLPVTFVLDRAGITGPDGPSHHGLWDAALLNLVPGLRMAAPRDPARLRDLLREALNVHNGPTAIRFPKASVGPDVDAVARMDGIDILYRGGGLPLDVLAVAAGVTAEPTVRAAARLAGQGIGVTVIDPRWILPVHPTIVHLAARHRVVVTVEDGVSVGGLGAAVGQACAERGVAVRSRTIGIPKAFVEHGDRGELLDLYGLTEDGITKAVLDTLATDRVAATGSAR